VAALFDTLETVGVTPVGADAVVFPLESVYQFTVPAVPFAILVVVAANVAVPAVPAVIAPVCAPRVVELPPPWLGGVVEEVPPPGIGQPLRTIRMTRHRDDAFFMMSSLTLKQVYVVIITIMLFPRRKQGFAPFSPEGPNDN
jgi:hypothetical protein